jgi:hypothetical protein
MKTRPQPKRYSLWWYQDEFGQIHKKTVPTGEPYPTEPWQRGMPPYTQERKLKEQQRLSQLHRGVPKTPKQRQLMSVAKTGVPKSLEHKYNMSLAHLQRIQRVRQLMQEQPELTYFQACTLEAKIRKTK